MNGSNYVRGKRGISLIAESLKHLQLRRFWQQCDPSIFQHVSKNVFELQLQSLMNSYTSQDQNSLKKFNEFRKHGCEKKESFIYWDKFINVLAHLTSSFRVGDWNLNLSSVYWAIPNCFAFDSVNCKRWLPLYYEDYLGLEQKYPEIHASFLKGGFVVQHSCKRESIVPIDQALEKGYNKLAKS